ncbi:MAG: acetolactate synthase [Desulfobacterales bacterium CG07_land_8_20_14_0_80_52_14]|nr:MAG: acetolactate synthase [Desulfobacterales bacterium CG23_combo_of_CG06-09_8_20_14_all_52_9]PIU50290.1 MAG: acetolactate synthase [Desulfobacterales bacterium CG07_land_8_20_14_0_80_52_14]
MKGNRALVRMLYEAGVDTLFGLCGDTSLPFYEALAGFEHPIRHILTRDERSASFMADAYARFSGKVGVCEGPSGGGALFILPGLAEANQSSVSLVCITSDIDVGQRERGTLTELDQDALFRPVTTWTRTPTSGRELPWVVREAFRRAVSGRLGATHIGLPLTVQEADVLERDIYIDPCFSAYPAYRAAPEPESVKRAAELLAESRHPVIVAGAGVIRSGAWAELKVLAELLGCPVATSISGKGAIAETHPLSLGVIGSNGGLPFRHDFIHQADLVFFIGCHAGSVTTIKWTLPPDRKKKILQLDVDASRIGVNYRVKEGIVADAKLGIAALIEAVADRLGGSRAGKTDPHRIAEKRVAYMDSIDAFTSDAVPIRPERFVKELENALPEDALVIADPGTPTPYLAAYYRLPEAGRGFVAPRAHGALGYALPAVVGAHYAQPDKKVVGVMGDGSFAISAGELETISRLNIPVLLIVLSNACFGWVKAGQKATGSPFFGVDFSAIDHAAVARAFRMKGIRVENPSALRSALENGIRSPRPVLIDVVIQPLHEAKAPVSKWIA